MKYKVRMIAFDLDGTLLTTDKRLTDETRRTLEQAAKRGILLVPATGRPLTGMPAEVLGLRESDTRLPPMVPELYLRRMGRSCGRS